MSQRLRGFWKNQNVPISTGTCSRKTPWLRFHRVRNHSISPRCDRFHEHVRSWWSTPSCWSWHHSAKCFRCNYFILLLPYMIPFFTPFLFIILYIVYRHRVLIILSFFRRTQAPLLRDNFLLKLHSLLLLPRQEFKLWMQLQELSQDQEHSLV